MLKLVFLDFLWINFFDIFDVSISDNCCILCFFCCVDMNFVSWIIDMLIYGLGDYNSFFFICVVSCCFKCWGMFVEVFIVYCFL